MILKKINVGKKDEIGNSEKKERVQIIFDKVCGRFE